MAIIKCQNCGNDVSDKAKQCPHCGITINNENGIETVLNKAKIRMETSDTTNKNKRKYNKVANKFNLVVWIIKFLGYLGAIISLIVFTQLGNFGVGLLVCIITCIITWFSTLIFEAISEGLQLLEDIKNK